MRTTISIPDELAREVRDILDDRSFSAFAREAIAARLDDLKRARLARQMEEGYRAEAEDPSLDPAWNAVEVDGW